MSPRRVERPAGGERSPAQQAIEADLLDQPETIACRMFGTTGYLMRDRLIAFWQGDSIVLKPPPDRRAALLESGIAGEFELRPGQSFGEWVKLPVTAPVDFRDLLAACREYVLSQPHRPRSRSPRPRPPRA